MCFQVCFWIIYSFTTKISHQFPRSRRTKSISTESTTLQHASQKSLQLTNATKITKKRRTRTTFVYPPTRNSSEEFSYVIESYQVPEAFLTSFDPQEELRKRASEFWDIYDPKYQEFFKWAYLAAIDRKRRRQREWFEPNITWEFDYSALLSTTPFPLPQDARSYFARVSHIERLFNLTTRLLFIDSNYDDRQYRYKPLF